VNYANHQALAATDNVEYTFQSESKVICSLAGILYWTGQATSYLAIKTTYGKNTLGHQDVANIRYCGYTPDCSNNVTPACGSPSWTDATSTDYPCSTWIRTSFLRVRAKSGSLTCVTGGSLNVTGNGPCDQ
jgi:hypothetical protein